MDLIQAILIAIVEGLTEYLPVSSTAHMGFTASLLNMDESEFLKMFQVSIQFGAILSIVVLYWKKFFDFSNLNFYLKLICAVIPALVLGYLFDDKIEAVLGNQIAISSVLVLGGIVLLFVDNWFKNPTIWQNTLQMLKSYQVGTVITDVAGRRDVCHQSLSTTTAMIRWVGNEHPSDYKRIDEWVQRIKQWLDKGLEELYIFVHICENTIAPEMANYWIQELNLHCNLEINPPKFLPKIEQMSLF